MHSQAYSVAHLHNTPLSYTYDLVKEYSLLKKSENCICNNFLENTWYLLQLYNSQILGMCTVEKDACNYWQLSGTKPSFFSNASFSIHFVDFFNTTFKCIADLQITRFCDGKILQASLFPNAL